MAIIKSMPVKQADWSNHYNYLAKDNNKLFSWGLNVDPYNEQDVIEQFNYNHQYLKQNSKAKNVYYHEVISLPEAQSSMTEQQKEEALYDLADRYVFSRAEGNLVIGGIHNDSSNMHMHLVISANSYMSTKSTRLSKKQFRIVQREIELYKNSKYPELKTNHYEPKHRAKNKQKRVEQEINRAKRQTKKQKVLQELKLILNNSKSKKELYQKVKDKNYRLYQRGKNIGIINLADSKRKYRLNTLEKDLNIKFVKKMKTLEQQQKIKQQVQNRITQEKQQQTKGLNYGKKI